MTSFVTLVDMSFYVCCGISFQLLIIDDVVLAKNDFGLIYGILVGIEKVPAQGEIKL